MERFRLSMLLLLVVIAALGIALVMQERRAARREAAAKAERMNIVLQLQVHEMNEQNLRGAIKILESNMATQRLISGDVAGDDDGK